MKVNEPELITEELIFNVEFYDVDSMNIVWHGNYVKYMEKARCALLDKIGYNYITLTKEGYLFPIVDVKVKYIRSLHFGEKVRAKAILVEYENRLKIRYEFYNAETNELTTKCESTQMVMDAATNETLFVCPDSLIEKVKKLLK